MAHFGIVAFSDWIRNGVEVLSHRTLLNKWSSRQEDRLRHSSHLSTAPISSICAIYEIKFFPCPSHVLTRSSSAKARDADSTS